jgi:hypothetical protein
MTSEPQRLGTAPFVVGGISFVPGLGILFGLIAIVWGLTSRKENANKLALLGLGGLIFNIVIYSALFYFAFGKRGGVYDDLRAQLAESALISTVQGIEFYKNQNGYYPESLEALRASLPKNSMTQIFDPTDIGIGHQPRNFYYELVDKDHYYLLGVGPDGKPFTHDDILPKLRASPGGNVGLVIKEQGK